VKPAIVTSEIPLEVQVQDALTSTPVQRTDGGAYSVDDQVLVAVVDGRLSIICPWEPVA
jgi:hypothetical protein